jgi:hypothetical protein
MFYAQFNVFIRSCSLHCIFVADETMVDAAKGAKCITLREGSPINVEFEHLPHVSVMCANNLTGTTIPPFMILPHHAFHGSFRSCHRWHCYSDGLSRNRRPVNAPNELIHTEFWKLCVLCTFRISRLNPSNDTMIHVTS